MADELELHFITDGRPDDTVARWRADPPPMIRNHGFKVADEAYNSVTYERRYLDWPQKILIASTLGFALIWKGFMESVEKLTVRFDAEGDRQTKVTLFGKVGPRTRAALGELVAQNGGAVGLRVGA
jgi:hypothetical protein